MNRNKCLGCGVKLQYEAEDLPGYIPSEKQGEAVLCQRCFQLRHYGRIRGRVTGETALQAVRHALRESELLLVVVDLFDPEGSLPQEWATLFTRPAVLVVNKADLLPPRTPWTEMEAWFGAMWRARFPAAELLAVKVLSTKKKGAAYTQNLAELKKLLQGKKVTVMGAANVGKTSLLTALLAGENGTDAGKLPTISKYPGTTQGIISWSLPSRALILMDTPGLVPGRRTGDLLSPVGAARLLPESKLQVKLWELPPQGAVLLGGLGGVWNCSPGARTLLFFAAEATMIHRTQGEKASQLLVVAPEWLRAFPPEEQPKKFDEGIFTVQPGEDLYFSGLGWVAVKKEEARLRVLAPAGVEVGIRPSLIGKKPD